MSIATDDFIRSSGNLAYVNTWLKLIALVLLLVSLLLGAALLVKIVDGRTEHVVPIVPFDSAWKAFGSVTTKSAIFHPSGSRKVVPTPGAVRTL